MLVSPSTDARRADNGYYHLLNQQINQQHHTPLTKLNPTTGFKYSDHFGYHDIIPFFFRIIVECIALHNIIKCIVRERQSFGCIDRLEMAVDRQITVKVMLATTGLSEATLLNKILALLGICIYQCLQSGTLGAYMLAPG